MSAARRSLVQPRFGRLFGLLLLVGVVTAVGVYQVHERYRVVRLGYEIGEERARHRRLLEQRKRLRLSLASYRDPEAVRTIAERHLGMERPDPEDRYRVLRPDGDAEAEGARDTAPSRRPATSNEDASEPAADDPSASDANEEGSR